MNENKVVGRLLVGNNENLLNTAILLLRLGVGITLFIVGSGKVLGWFGGSGLEKAIQIYTKMGIAPPLAYLSCFTEFLGGILLIVGFLTRPAAIPVAINMLVATQVMLSRGFVASIAPFSVLVATIVILLTGPMGFSLDSRFIGSRQSAPKVMAQGVEEK